MIRVGLFPPRFLTGGRRWHHGTFGCATLTIGIAQGSPLLVLAGAMLICDDLQDRGSWLRDLAKHPEAR